MHGDDFVRHCRQCDKNVYDLSRLTAEAAVDKMREKEGKLCIQIWKRQDGTVLTADCPVGVRTSLRRFWRWSAALFATLFFTGCGERHVCTMGVPVRLDDPSTKLPHPDDVICAWATVWPGPTIDPEIRDILLTPNDYAYIRGILVKGKQTSQKLRDFDKLGAIKVTARSEIVTEITYYWAGKGAVHFTVDDGSRVYVALDAETDSVKMKDLGMVLTNYVRDKAKKK